MNKRTQLTRLIKLHNRLLDVPDQQFDQRRWCSDVRQKLDLGCGTVACIGGWATTVIPELRLRKTNWGTTGIWNIETGHSAAVAFGEAFGLTSVDAYAITENNGRRETPKIAAAAVLKLARRMAKGTNYIFPEIS